MYAIPSTIKDWLRRIRRQKEQKEYSKEKQHHIAAALATWREMDENEREWVLWEDSGLDRFLPKDEMEALIERRELSDQIFKQVGEQLLVNKTVFLVDAATLAISDGGEYPWKDVWVALLEGQSIWKAMATVRDTLNYGDSGFSDF